MDSESITSFPGDIISVHDDTWKSIQVVGEGSSSAGSNVSLLSAILAETPIYFLSTFNDDFILVPANKITQAISTLEKQFNIVADDA